MSIMPMSALMSALRGAGRQHLTASTVAARQAVTGSHVLRLQGYRQVIGKTVPNGTAVTSTTFRVGGHDWRLECYPNGDSKETDGHTSIFLANLRGGATARFELSVLDRAGRPSCTRTSKMRLFSAAEQSSWGWKDFVKNDDLDLVDDCLTVLCDVTVDAGLRADEELAAEVSTPPSSVDLRGQLSDVIWGTQPTDVTVYVGGETIAAHRRVLEAGSPVFKEALQNTSELRIPDMEAEVFNALMEFVYTDSVPETHHLEVPTMAERLLVAADRYRLEKLKVACGEVLCARVDMGSVAAMLALAERHHCAVLKEACVKFLTCPGNLTLFMATDGFERLRKECPAAAVEIIVKQLPELHGWKQN